MPRDAHRLHRLPQKRHEFLEQCGSSLDGFAIPREPGSSRGGRVQWDGRFLRAWGGGASYLLQTYADTVRSPRRGRLVRGCISGGERIGLVDDLAIATALQDSTEIRK